MDNYMVILAKNSGKKYNIQKLVSNLAWSDALETLGTQLTFDFIRNREDLNFSKFDLIEIGDKIILKNNENETFRGIITDVSWNRYSKGINCFDYAFYLNQSKTIKQFHNITASKAIKELCGMFSIPVGTIDEMTTNINKIYKDKTIAEIIKDILLQVQNETGIEYRLEMLEGKLYITKYKEITVDLQFQPAETLATFDITKILGNISKNESIQNMRNSVLVSSQDQESTRIVQKAEDKKSIEVFGLLQDVLTLDDKNESQTKNVAQNKLEKLNKVQEDINISVLGNDSLRAGRIISIENKLFDLSGKYLIKSSSHTYNNSIHKCDLILEGVK